MGHIQAKNVPDDVHEAIRQMASHEGMTVSEFTVDALRRRVERLSLAQWLEHVRSHPPVRQDIDSVAFIDEVRAEFDGR